MKKTSVVVKVPRRKLSSVENSLCWAAMLIPTVTSVLAVGSVVRLTTFTPLVTIRDTHILGTAASTFSASGAVRSRSKGVLMEHFTRLNLRLANQKWIRHLANLPRTWYLCSIKCLRHYRTYKGKNKFETV